MHWSLGFSLDSHFFSNLLISALSAGPTHGPDLAHREGVRFISPDRENDQDEDKSYFTWFVHFDDFVQFLPGANFVEGPFESLSTSSKICQVVTNHPLVQTSQTWNRFEIDRKAFVTAENLSKALFALRRKFEFSVCKKKKIENFVITNFLFS